MFSAPATWTSVQKEFKLINEDEQEVDPESDPDKNNFILLKFRV